MSAIHNNHWKYLERDPYSSCKQLSIKGRRIRARTIFGAYMNEEEPMTPEEIAADRDLPLAAVLEAIAYCESNPPEIAEDFRREEALAEALGMNDPNYKYNPQPRQLTPQERAAVDGL
jgi:uncharacterized protein (DUF433 family)